MNLRQQVVFFKTILVSFLSLILENHCFYNNQLIILLNSHMRKYQIYLSIGNMREYKHHSSTSNYYLCVQNELREREYSFCQNIILTEGVFTFIVGKQIKLVQIWNYDKKKKIGTVMLKRQKETCHFVYQFKNFNLKLIIKSFNLILACQELNLLSKGSIQTAESQNEQNSSEDYQL